eukprot:scaffold75972_cov19-Prasinocladus_malaysianus.AAC.1
MDAEAGLIEAEKLVSGGDGLRSPESARVSFVTAVLLGCALAFHSLLEVSLFPVGAFQWL